MTMEVDVAGTDMTTFFEFCVVLYCHKESLQLAIKQLQLTHQVEHWTYGFRRQHLVGALCLFVINLSNDPEEREMKDVSLFIAIMAFT